MVDWDLIAKLGRRARLLSESEESDLECTPIARRWLEATFKGSIAWPSMGSKARGCVLTQYGQGVMKHWTNCIAGEILARR